MYLQEGVRTSIKTIKGHMYFNGWFECQCATDELDELWRVEEDIIEEAIHNRLSRGASIRARRCSKYPLTPLNEEAMSVGRTERVGGGGA